MDPVWLFLLSIAAIFLIGALGELTFQRTNIPDVIWLFLAGLMLGPLFGFVTQDNLRAMAPYFAALTLVIVLFEGGSTLRLRELRRGAPRATLLSLLTFAFAVVVVAAVSLGARSAGVLPEEWSAMHGLMLGCILGGPSAIVVVPAIAQARLNTRLANLLNLESALTDALSVVGTVAIIDILRGRIVDDPLMSLLRSFGVGIAAGAVAGIVWIVFLKMLRSPEHAYPVTLSALLILYVVIDNFGGSAALGILTMALVLGNAPSIARALGLADGADLASTVRGFHRQVAFMIKSFFFVFMGAMLGGPILPLLFGLVLGAMLLVSRVPAVRLATLGSGFTPTERQLVTTALPRGMAAGVLATLPMSKGVDAAEAVPVVVFATVLTTTLIFAIGFPIVRKRVPPSPEAEQGPFPLPAGAARPSVPPQGRPG